MAASSVSGPRTQQQPSEPRHESRCRLGAPGRLEPSSRQMGLGTVPATATLQPLDPPDAGGWNVERHEPDPLAFDSQTRARNGGMAPIGELHDRPCGRQHVEALLDDCVAFVLLQVAKRKGGDHHRGRADGLLSKEGTDASRLAFDHDGTRESVLEPPAKLPIPLDEHELLLRDPAREKGSGDAAGPGAELDDRACAVSGLPARASHDPCQGLRAWQDRANPARVRGPALHKQTKSAAAKSRAGALRTGLDRRIPSHDSAPGPVSDRASARPFGNRPRRRPRTAGASHSPRKRCTSTER